MTKTIKTNKPGLADPGLDKGLALDGNYFITIAPDEPIRWYKTFNDYAVAAFANITKATIDDAACNLRLETTAGSFTAEIIEHHAYGNPNVSYIAVISPDNSSSEILSASADMVINARHSPETTRALAFDCAMEKTSDWIDELTTTPTSENNHLRINKPLARIEKIIDRCKNNKENNFNSSDYLVTSDSGDEYYIELMPTRSSHKHKYAGCVRDDSGDQILSVGAPDYSATLNLAKVHLTEYLDRMKEIRQKDELDQGR